MKIGNIETPNNLFLAPIAGFSDIGMRYLALMYGAGLTFTEMVSAKGLFYRSEKTKVLLETHEKEKIKAAQIFGSEAEIMSEVIGYDILKKFDIIDINMGCPVKKIVGNGEGCALMASPDKVYHLVKACVKAAGDRNITAKIRSGLTKDNLNAVEVAQAIEDGGAKMVTVHGRDRDMFYKGKCDLDIIKAVKQNVKIPVCGNGDVTDRNSYLRMIEYTGVDAVMIARAAIGNPNIFSEILEIKAEYDIIDLIKTHITELLKILPERVVVADMKKQLSFYIKPFKNQKRVKELAFSAKNLDELYHSLDFLQLN